MCQTVRSRDAFHRYKDGTKKFQYSGNTQITLLHETTLVLDNWSSLSSLLILCSSFMTALRIVAAGRGEPSAVRTMSFQSSLDIVLPIEDRPSDATMDFSTGKQLMIRPHFIGGFVTVYFHFTNQSLFFI